MASTARRFSAEGLRGRRNTLLLQPPLRSGTGGAAPLAVFFPGDISDWEEAMPEGQAHWAIERLAAHVAARMPQHALAVVRAAPPVQPPEGSEALGPFARYTNFFDHDATGHPLPIGEEDGEELRFAACNQLQGLLSAVAAGAPGALGPDCDPRSSRLALLGFSKGATVLTRMVEQPVAALWERVSSVHYLDAGLNKPGIFPVDEAQWTALAALFGSSAAKPVINLHGTPRQLADHSRPFIREEYMACADAVRAAGLRCEQREYGGPMTLETHFKVLELFEP
eukprot:TRINITY_DN67609_c0_g1_i1.p1 TRINITY_DN67609_c0_g1~~TRINITY_DN67609_c0_g1_i1.p1  ORF type:complete len:282 (+),score=81.88 TRINITY_DN67609_c0_g1_i1:125-970(+)